MRLIIFFSFFVLVFFVSTASSITFNDNDTIPIENVTYKFVNNTSFDSISIINKTISFNDVVFNVTTTQPIDIIVSRVASNNSFDFVISSEESCSIKLNISGIVYTIEHAKGNETISMGNNIVNSSVEPSDVVTDMFGVVYPVMFIMMAAFFIWFMFSRYTY